ncbi:MAG: primosomal protein N' [Bacteroidales bacterium]|jgi:primosomal protein N' (replication factor Y)|nr:primosomal protein N' [Bacteroidales bacterium]
MLTSANKTFNNDTIFVEVILPLHLPSTFTYRVPREFVEQILVGQRVAVQFGSKRIYSAIVADIHNRIPKVQSVKYVLAILDFQPIVLAKNIAFWRWIASYYCCYLGDVMAAALPAALRLKSETKVIINPDFDGDISNLNKEEQLLISAISKKESVAIADISKATAIEVNILPIIQTLIRKKILTTDEELYDRYEPKKESVVMLAEKYRNDSNNKDTENTVLQQLFTEFESNKKYEKQYQALLAYFSLRQNGDWNVKKLDLIEHNISSNTLNTLIKKKILVSTKKIVSRLKKTPASAELYDLTLTDEQKKIFDNILSLPNNKVSLLHGVTASGKTEVYIKLIEQTLKANKQVLFLLPEISLTAQLVSRLEKYFGENVGVYHSRFSKEERAEIWSKVGEYKIIIGSRSAVFLPFSNLGLIIVDEEHDNSYKQSEPSPRYNGKDAAIWLGYQHNAKVILGSATPSIETYYNAQTGKYALFELKTRYGSVALPEILISDLKEAKRNGELYSIFSKLLLENINTALKNREQVILFQNRRGFAPSVQCEICGYIPKCPNCDVSLTLHKISASLNCHYCNFNQPLLKVCPQCGSAALKMFGFGTEKIEEELAIYFPNACIKRMDLDSTRSKNAYQKLILAFEKREIDILVGTQMLSKGLDFDNVSVVGILNADNLLAIPDFRSYEKAYQMLTQVSGRAGRRKKGKVIIQTCNPYHQVIRDVSEHNYLSMFNSQILERKVFKYPPFYKLVKIELSHVNKTILDAAATDYSKEIRHIFSSERILGPQEPPIAKIKNRYRMQVWLKLEANLSYSSAKTEILRLNEAFFSNEKYKSMKYFVDIDPQ